MAAVRVPAWKRLGLELANKPVHEHDAAPASKKRKLEKAQHQSSVEELATSFVAPMAEPLHGTSLNDGEKVSAQAEPDATATSSELKRKVRKKSVSFATGTASEKANVKPLVPDQDEASKEAKRKRKQEAREVRRNKESASRANEPGEDKATSHVRYLYLYHTNRAQWKFNKSTQSSLLKDCFNLYRVPPEYGPALMEYISGLQGHAARARLAEEARKTMDEADKTVKEGFTSLKSRSMDPMNLTEEYVYIPPPSDLSPEKAKEWEAYMMWKKEIFQEWNDKEAAIAADPEKAMTEYAERRDFVGHMKRHKITDDQVRKDTIEYRFEMLKRRRGEEILNAVKMMMNAMVAEEREKKQQELLAAGKPAKPQYDALAPKIVNKPKKSRGRKRRTAAVDEESSESSSSDSSDADSDGE